MTDNIQKLYEVAGVEYCVACPCYTEQINICIKNKIDNKTCAKTNKLYPPFTAEKQLELIKWLVKRGLLQISYSSFGNFQFCNFTHGGDYKAELNEALANFILQLWDGLSSEQREEVRGILQ